MTGKPHAEVRRRFAAAPEKVFAAFADARLIIRWLSPSPEITLTLREISTDERKNKNDALLPRHSRLCRANVRPRLCGHLILFEQYYQPLAIYRSDIIIPLGFLSMLIQATIFAWIYQRTFARRNAMLLLRGLLYAACGAALSWSFTTIAVAAKNVMASVPDYLVIETAFTVVQWIMVGPLTALAFGQLSPRDDEVRASNIAG
jgi:hypothetical protein